MTPELAAHAQERVAEAELARELALIRAERRFALELFSARVDRAYRARDAAIAAIIETPAWPLRQHAGPGP